MRIVDVRELTIPISRYADSAIASGGLTTSLVAVVTDVIRSGKPVVGFGFASIGRFGQGGLIRERFAPRLIAADTLAGDTGDTLDPQRAWTAMMHGEIRHFVDLGFTLAKIKIGDDLDQDLVRIDTALARLSGPSCLAVDAMNRYGPDAAREAAHALAPLGLLWFEDICDPLDFETLSCVATSYAPPIAAGEALFSRAEARLLDAHGGLRRHRDILLFDPTHCYGLTHYCEIVAEMTERGWPREAFWPHGGHLFGLHVVAGLHLGGAEINPLAFAPFQAMPSALTITDGRIDLPQAPGIGFELHDATRQAFRRLLD